MIINENILLSMNGAEALGLVEEICLMEKAGSIAPYSQLYRIHKLLSHRLHLATEYAI